MSHPVTFYGGFREGGPLALVGLLTRLDQVTPLEQGDVLTYSLRIYDPDSDTPETPIWADIDQGAGGAFYNGVETSGYRMQAPGGYNFLLKIGHDQLDNPGGLNFSNVGGRNYRCVLTITSTDQELDNASWVWLVDCEAA